MKKVFALFLVVLMLFSMMPTAYAADGDPPGEPGGVQKPSESYYNPEHAFGYDSMASNGTLTGISVSVGGAALTEGNATSTTAAALASGVTITFDPGYYLNSYKIVCGDKYDCNTAAAGMAKTETSVMAGASKASHTVTLTKTDMGHASMKGPYWILLEILQDSNKYKVTYNWGDLEGLLTVAPPATEEHLVNDNVTVKSGDQAALDQAAALGYRFVGWKIDTGSEKIYQAGNEFWMPAKDVTLTALWEIAPVDVTVTKNWADGSNQDGIRPGSIQVQLYADGVAKGDPVTLSGSGNSWTYTWTGLPGGKIIYTVDEVNVPEGYTKSVNGNVITNTHTPETIAVSGSKNWIDGGNQDGIRPASITVRLFADGKEVDSKTVTAADGWKWSFTDLPKYANGVEIVYTVVEDEVAGYTASINGYDITNTHTPETVSVSGVKSWDDANDQDGKRPESITIRLYADGTEIASKTVTAADGWKWTFTNLPKNKAGKAIVYTVTEDAVDGYTSAVSGYNVTNSYTPETISVSGAKTWDDSDDQDGKRPASITVNLLADGVVVASKFITEAEGWAWNFTGLDKYRDQGVEIVYTIEEEAVEDYTATVNGYDITNSHTPETVTLSGAKTWADNNDQDGIRPESITVRLFASGVEVASKTVTEADGWKWSFTDLPKYANGTEIIYILTEDSVEGYTISISGYDVTNSYIPETTEVAGTKTWDDNNNQDGIRPQSITVNLLADGVKVDSKTVTEADGWKWSFTDLPKNKEGKVIVYTVEEEAVEGYTASVEGFDITNTHTPVVVTISGAKTWVDGDDQDGKRPDSITINLLADGVKVASQTVKASDDWAWSFVDMPKYADGKEIVYTITEDAVEGYTTEVKDYNVTNTHITETTSVSGSKTWQDNNNQDGLRPESITINLLANGEKVASKVVTAADEWKWSFTDLPMYEAGKKITYTITENAVTGYTATVVGYNVVNVHIPETVTVSGNKTWIDGDDQDGIRPDSITVNLYADGVKVDSVEVKPGLFGIWSYSFRGLPKYNNGVEIHYTVSEEAVEGYIGKVNGYDITNTHDPEETQLTVKKVWDDKDDENKKRPDSIKVTLYANGKSTGKTLTLSAGNKWSGTFQDLPKYDDGKLIKYTVKEASVSNYKASYAYSGTNVTITNTFSVIPVTGDFSELYGHMMIMGLSAAALVVLGIITKRKFLF